MTVEQWKRIPWNKDYEISTLGSIRRVEDGKELRLSANEPGGYLRATIDGKRYYVHQLMMETFEGWKPGSASIAHIDGDPQNNALDNLEIIERGKGSKYRGRRVNYTCRTCANRGQYAMCKDRNDTFFCSLGKRQ